MIRQICPALVTFLSAARRCKTSRQSLVHRLAFSLTAALMMIGSPALGQSITYTGSLNYTENDADWTISSNNFFVGYLGTGSLTLSGGGRVSANNLIIGQGPGIQGVVTVGGTGSHISLTGENILVVGNFGSGEITIDSGSLVIAPYITIGFSSGSTGVLNINGTAGARGTLETNSLSEGSGSGTLSFNGGVLRALAAGDFIKDFEAGEIQIQTGGVFIDSNNYDTNANSVMQGGGALTKQGEGRLYLRAANEYTGGTVIETGALVTANSTGSATGTGAVTVNSGAALAGNGFVVSSGITLNASSMLRIGEAHGAGGNDTLTLGATGSNLILSSSADSLYQFDISGATISDLLILQGNSQTAITLGGKIQLSSSTFSGLAIGQSWTLIDWSNIVSNSGSVISQLTLDSSLPDLSGLGTAAWETYISGNALHLRIAAVPEPARALFLFLGLAVVFLRRHRRC